VDFFASKDRFSRKKMRKFPRIRWLAARQDMKPFQKTRQWVRGIWTLGAMDEGGR
jgi:hypothetical protein